MSEVSEGDLSICVPKSSVSQRKDFSREGVKSQIMSNISSSQNRSQYRYNSLAVERLILKQEVRQESQNEGSKINLKDVN